MYMKKNKRKVWSESEIDFLVKNYSEMFNSELVKILDRSELSIYVKANKLGLSKSSEHKSRCISKRNKMVGRNLTNDALGLIAKEYKTKTEFQKNDPSAYSSARRRGIINEICSHMISKSFSIPQLILKDVISKIYKTKDINYNDRKTLKPYEIDVYLPEYKIGFEYNGKGWHNNNTRDELKNKLSLLNGITLITISENNREYEDDIKKQLICNIEKLKIKIDASQINEVIIDNPYSMVYNIEDLRKIANSYTSFIDFYKNEKSIYTKIMRLGLIDEMTDHMCCRRKKRELGEIVEKINKYQYLNELIINDSNTYSYVKKNKLDHLLINLKRIRK
jgi:hypothetical protein